MAERGQCGGGGFGWTATASSGIGEARAGGRLGAIVGLSSGCGVGHLSVDGQRKTGLGRRSPGGVRRHGTLIRGRCILGERKEAERIDIGRGVGW